MWQGNPFRPFCSERCRLIDLDNWLSERYRIAGAAEEDGEKHPEPVRPEITDAGGRRG
jgi:endogenous inhibitor of DNA gyrase (YacG/DUF329 family)